MIPRIVIAILITVCVIPPTRGSEAETKQGSLPSPPGDAQQKAPKATLTPKQLRELLKDYRKLTTLSIEYSINMRPGSASADYSQSGVHRRIVAKAPCFFYHDSGHATESIDWQDDPYRQMCYFDKNQETITYALNRSFAQRSYGADKPLDGTMATEFFFVSTGIWPLSGRRPPRPTDTPCILTEVAESEAHNQVRESLEYVAGAWCHVLFSEGKDYLWIDATHGARLLKREIHDLAGGALMSRYSMTEHQQILPGLWCPARIRSEQFDFNAPTPDGQKRLMIDSEAVVSKISAEPVNEDFFSFQPSPGWLKHNMEDVRTPPVQAVPGGEGMMDDLSVWIKRCRIRPAEMAPAYGRHYAAAATLLLISIACCEAFLWNRRLRGGV
ncbi:hypothetical protein [Singulisphaera acidiphila]|uniref:Uncharacterized protein n=1 Tax=Singulisphaera acidiphila (strain ATCC BAA-1392 / DSM 18658 / VKM B-2454 / MOB10) TaxID=886293 RepID=L0DIM4_SINAD|nr:hypothetical protein [Singulisphaera acidiphila]AGA28496.1 hypothetical protein Sinac_4297 [Singulisphaera acidiphila DSM 18658]